ncbi:MAG: TonB-dependent receptor [Bacteroidales bacterium]|nr:TonB-dependent receptor [Bacteroidales bacterium]
MKRFLLSFIFVMAIVPLLTAQRHTVSGVVKDNSNGETVKGIMVSLMPVEDVSQAFTGFSNQAGFYSITAPKGTYIFFIQYLGYQDIKDTIELTENITKNIDLLPEAEMLENIVVSDVAVDHNVTSAEVGKMEMKIETIKTLPALFGEVDVLKSIQLLPGIQSGGEGNTGFYVRGGGSDQNLVLLDETTIYNAGHLFGFFSVFNADAVKNVEITKSGMPAYYGGRLASVLDVAQKEGNMKKFEVDGGLGLIFSRITVQGPIKKDRCSFILSGRRTYIDAVVQPFLKKTSPLKGTKFYFYDLNAKLNIILNDKHHLFIGAYYGKDVYGFKSSTGSTKAQFRWGNAAAAIRWNYIINHQLFLNTSFNFTNYDFATDMGLDIYSMEMSSGVRDYSFKTELTYLPPFHHEFKFGLQYTFHTFFPNKFAVEAGENQDLTLPNVDPYYGHELAIYANDEFDIFKWWKMNVGVRYTHFEFIGPFTRYVFNEQGLLTDSIVYRPGQIIKQYNHVEPRLSMRFQVAKATSIKCSYTLNYQYLHQVALATISLPTDVWMPSTEIVKPQVGHQVSLGVYQNFRNNMFETYADFYYKHMNNLVEYKDGINIQDISQNADQMYVFGKGWSYGVELFLKKATGRFTGFIGYTLSFTQRQFDELNGGKPFYAKYDRRHDVSINLCYEILRNKLSVSAVWIFASGNTMTIPIGYYFICGSIVTEYSDRNAYRLDPYHRLDLSLNWTICKRKRFETGLNFSVYNVYNRKNPFFIYFETNTNFQPNESFEMTTKAYQMSLFPILPSITWNFKF